MIVLLREVLPRRSLFSPNYEDAPAPSTLTQVEDRISRIQNHPLIQDLTLSWMAKADSLGGCSPGNMKRYSDEGAERAAPSGQEAGSMHALH